MGSSGYSDTQVQNAIEALLDEKTKRSLHGRRLGSYGVVCEGFCTECLRFEVCITNTKDV